ncbi:MAG TPA: Flp pilus assembly protein CpaB, partial [Stellaceae bacterium]|nr:Flp pilus assembly protein CpaB [Stellaceae bacterium]
MRPRSLVLFTVALALAGGTTLIARGWLAQQAAKAAALAMPKAAPARSVLVARQALARGQILRPQDFSWQVWPAGRLEHAYILAGTRPIKAFAGWVARDPIGAGEPVTETKIVAPGNRGFLAAVLRPGMRAVSVPITVTSGISGFVFPGDRVDLLITYPVRLKDGAGDPTQHKAAETVLRDVRVIAIDQKLVSKDGEATVAHTATLEVTPKQSEIIAVASQMGQLSLSLRSLVNPSDHQLADSTSG